MKSDFEGKAAIVTGAGSGIGAAISRQIAQRGASVIVSDIDAASAERIAAEIVSLGGTAHAFAADVADPAAVEKMVGFAVEQCGGLHLAVNNAGISGLRKATADYPLDEWHRLMDINLNGVFYCMKHEIAAMRAAGGAIVNMASVLGSVGLPTAPAYTAAKHAVVGLTKAAAMEYARSGIRINAVGPGWIETPLWTQQAEEAATRRLMAMQPMARLGTPEEVANVVCFLLSDEASFVTGSYHLVDGAYTAH